MKAQPATMFATHRQPQNHTHMSSMHDDCVMLSKVCACHCTASSILGWLQHANHVCSMHYTGMHKICPTRPNLMCTLDMLYYMVCHMLYTRGHVYLRVCYIFKCLSGYRIIPSYSPMALVKMQHTDDIKHMRSRQCCLSLHQFCIPLFPDEGNGGHV